MKKFSCLAIDMGAGSIRAMLGVFDQKITISELFRFDNSIVEQNGYERWNLDAIHQGIATCVKKALDSDTPPSSISVDSWGVDFVLLGHDGKPLGWPIAYRDKRTHGMQEKWDEGYLSKQETFNKTGINYYPFNTLFQLLAMKNHPIWERTDRLLFSANYILYHLSGVAVNELSLSSTSQLLNIGTMDWDQEILSHLGITERLLGKPVECGQIIGKLKPCFNKNTIDICLVPSHDTAAAIEAIPVKTENYAYISTGTWCIAGMPSDKPITSNLALEAGITNEVSTCHKIKINKNIMGLWLIQKLREVLMPGVGYDKIDLLARNCEWNGVTIDPNNSHFYNPVNMHLAFDQVLEEQGATKFKSAAEYFRCAYESLAKSFYKTLKIMEHLRGKPFEVIHVLGGGAQSELLCQLTANHSRIPVIAGPVEGAAIGNMIWQARAHDFFDSEKEVSDWISRSFQVKTYLPK